MTDDAFKVSMNADGTEPLLLTKMLNLFIDAIRVHMANRNYHGGRIKEVPFELMVEVFKSITCVQRTFMDLTRESSCHSNAMLILNQTQPCSS